MKVPADHPWAVTTTVIGRDDVGQWLAQEQRRGSADILVFASRIMCNGLLTQGLIDELPTDAMVAINRTAVRAPFMVLFFGTAAGCGATVVNEIMDPHPSSLLRAVGSAACLVGWAVTMAVNVPLNNHLAHSGPDHWPDYQRSWARANHIRAALSITGALGLLIHPQP